LTWSGIHASVSIALILGISETGAFADLLVEQLSAMVFGVAAFTLLVNGPPMGRLLDRVGIGQQTQPQRLYESLIGRIHGVDAAIDTAERLRNRNEISESVFEDVTAVYSRERAKLEAATSSRYSISIPTPVATRNNSKPGVSSSRNTKLSMR
jgi:monovalent cation:H+ antiporter, CPA1 family